MELHHVECRDFRCLEHVCFDPAPGVNIVRGGNAQGKTSVLEAILYTASTKSHRTNNDADLARHGTGQFHTRVEGTRGPHTVALEAHYWEGAKRFKVNGGHQPRLSDILGKVNVVFFCPEDADLVRGGAGGRRRFLDMEISQIDPAYLAALQSYRHLLRQRNELLRAARPDHAQLDAWDVQLARAGSALVRGRREFVEALAVHATAAYARIAHAEELALRYDPDTAAGEALEYALTRSRETDLRRGLTTHGPHRDDLLVTVGGRPARQFGSQGQQKTAALALKLAETELVKTHTGAYPVLMLDEVLAELDADRARRLFEGIGPEIQTLVTTTEQTPRPGRFGAQTTHFRIEHGRLTRDRE